MHWSDHSDEEKVEVGKDRGFAFFSQFTCYFFNKLKKKINGLFNNRMKIKIAEISLVKKTLPINK